MQGKQTRWQWNCNTADKLTVPSNLILNKMGKPAFYLPTVMILWGIISGATGGVQSYGGLIACRFFLGFVEAAYFVSVGFADILISTHSL
jgi:hypothetical protein